ncbi:MAG: IS21 family transposase [Anaeromyxobacter sp.]|nr:IS21 family transposase [Anaeromyxobacter sp.]
MAFREVMVLEVKEILRLWLAGAPKKRVAQQLGFDVKTVRRYLAAAKARGLEQAHGVEALTDELVAAVLAETQPATGRPRSDGWATCEARKSFIEKHLVHGVRLTKVRKLLQREGVDVGYQTLRRFALEHLDFGQASPTVPVADCEPGAEVQLDTGWMTMLEPDAVGRRRRFRAWIFTAVRSRHRFVHPVLRETTETAIEACEAAWEFFGGIFKVVIVDNTKTIVTTADPVAPKLNETFLEYAQARGFVIDTARVRHPKDKARVERSVQTVRDDCFGGERLRSVEGAQERARDWCLREYGRRRHSTTQRLPLEHFEAEEKSALLPPPTTPYDVPIWCDPKVAPDQFAQVAKALYSIPLDYRRKLVRARADRQLVRFWYRGQLIKTHPRVAPGKRSIDPADFPPESLATAQRDGAFWVRRAREQGEHVGRFAEALLATPAPWTRMRQVYRLISLAERFGSARVDASCQTALAAGMVDVFRLSDLVRLDTRLAAPPTNVIPLARFLRPASQYALPLASRERPVEGEDRDP